MINFQEIVDEVFIENCLPKEAGEKETIVANRNENYLDLANKLEKVSFLGIGGWINRQQGTTREIKEEEKALERAKQKEKEIKLRRSVEEQVKKNEKLSRGELSTISKYKYPLAIGAAGIGAWALARNLNKPNRDQSQRLAKKYYLEGYRRGTGFIKTKGRE